MLTIEFGAAWPVELELRVDYNLIRIDEMPEVECHFALSQDGWWGGVAEPGGAPVPPTAANAIVFANGKGIRSTPISRHDLSWS